MATPEEISALRPMIGDESEPYKRTDEVLSAMIDEDGSNLNRTASRIHGFEAVRLSRLVNTSESGSSRAMGDLYKNALALSKYYDDLDVDVPEVATTDRPRTRRIVRR